MRLIQIIIFLLVGFHDLFAQNIKFNEIEESCGDSIFLLFQDDRGFVWLSTEKGLGIFDGIRFMPTRFYGTEGDIFSEIVKGMYQVDKEHIAVSTDKGQMLLDLKHDSYNAIDSGKGFIIPSGKRKLVDNNGNLWTISKNGVDIHYSKFNDSVDLKNLHIIGIYINNQLMIGDGKYKKNYHSSQANVDFLKEISLDYSQNDIFIHFIYTSYTKTKPDFWYRLKGYDESWKKIVSLHDGVKFVHLKPGTYILEVTSNPVKDYQNNCYFLRINIQRPWWNSWWAYNIYAIAFIIIVVIIKKIKIARKLGRKSDETINKVDEIKNIAKPSKDKIETPIKSKDCDKEQQFINRVALIIENNYSNPEYDVLKLSSELCMSRATLFRKFQTHIGQSPAEYIRNFRLEKASLLLLNSEKTITEVALEVGFSDIGHFSKCFRIKYAVNPSQYRLKSQN